MQQKSGGFSASDEIIISLKKETSVNNDNHFDDDSFVFLGIDKITLGMESRHLNYTKSPDELKYIIDIVNYGDWSKLHIQLEINGQSSIDFYNPWLSILHALQICIHHGFFTEPISNRLQYFIQGIYFGMLHPISFIYQFFNTGIFRLDEYELFFDFYGYNPILEFEEEHYRFYENSVYTKDYRIKKRRNGEIKGKRRSMFCFYKRGIKIGSPYTINRLEFRICDDRAKAILTPIDILYPVPYFIELHGDQIKQTLKRYLPEGSINMDTDYINKNIPILSRLFWLLDKTGGEN